jgi:hypothetical protein
MKLLQRLLVAALLCAPAVPAHGQDELLTRRQYGVSVTRALSLAPLGRMAETYGMTAIPGNEYGVRLVTRSARGSEWTLGVLADEYRLEHRLAGDARAAFEYSSHAVVLERAWTETTGRVPVRYGAEAGWRGFSVDSRHPNAYTDEMEHTDVRGDAALFAVSFGIEVPSYMGTMVPRLRIETNFPDFGGGDGYSRLHRQSGLGFRASFGVELRLLTRGRTE